MVVEGGNRDLIGFLVASIRTYATAGNIAVSLDVAFVLPPYRATTAGEDLLDEFHRWASRLNAAEVFVDDPEYRRGPLRRYATTLRRDFVRHFRGLKG